MMCRRFVPSLLALGAVLSGCGGSNDSPVIQAIVDQPNCSTGQDRLWSALYREVDQRGELPSAESIESKVRGLANGSAHADALVAAYAVVSRETRFLPRSEALVRLAEMEIGDRTTAEKRVRQDEVDSKFARAKEASIEALGSCPVVNPPSPGAGFDPVPMFETWRLSEAAAVYGAHKVFSVGYQSCNAVGLSPLLIGSASVEGISIVGRHENGIGQAREVTDPEAVFRTNRYYALRTSPGSGCFTSPDVPLIYDYGGKPYASTTGAGTLDLFKDGGSGTDALGIDCSGFVASAVITGGLRLKQNVTSKAAQSGGVSASMFADPSGNGLSCFARVASTPTQNLRAGDVIANTGHVVLVDKVGADPLGALSPTTAAGCDAITTSKFDFTIIQSSPSKGGIGMNRYRASDYFGGTVSMKNGLVAYARSFCRVRLGIDPSTTLASPSTAVVIRHNGGTACTDAPIPIAGESCLQSCGALAAVGI